MEDWLKKAVSFDTMITPFIIKIVFWIGVIGCVVGGIGMFFNGAGFISGLLCIVLGPLAVRIYCELVMVIFKIFEALKQIAEKPTGTGPRYSNPDPDTQFTAPSAEPPEFIE